MKNKQAQHTENLTCRPRLTGAQARTCLMALGIACAAGGLVQVSAQSSEHSGHSARPTVENKPVTLALHSSRNRAGSAGNLKHFLVLNSRDTLKKDDKRLQVPPHQNIHISDVQALYPDTTLALSQEPESQPGISYDEPDAILKSHDDVRLAPSDAIARNRSDWISYLLVCRKVAGWLGVSGVPYPTPPVLSSEARWEYGPERVVEAGPPASSPNAPFGVYMSGAYMSRDRVSTPCVAQYASIANWCGNKTEERLMDPTLDVPAYQENRLHTRACEAGNEAAHTDLELAHSRTLSSQERGFYARRALRKYHAGYSRVYHQK